MPTVRTYGPTKVATAALPGVRKQASETALSEGAGYQQARAQKFGTIAAEGSQFAAVATGIVARGVQEERAAADNTALLEAETKLGKWENARLYDPETGALAVKGKDAMPLPEQVGTEYEKVAGDIASGLSTDRQRAAFARVRANHALNLDGTLRRHVYGEMQTYEKQELASFVDTSTSTAIANAADPRRVGEELQKITDAIDLHGKRLGLGADGIVAAKLKATTSVHTGVIDRLLADGNDKGAQVYFEETKSQIDGDALAKIEKALDEGKLRGQGQRAADEIITAGGTLTQQRDKAKAIDDPKLRDEVMQRIEHESNVNEKAQRDAEENRSIQGYDILDKTQNVARIPPALWASYSGATRSAMRSYAEHLAKGEDVETDAPTYYALIQQAAGAPGYGTANEFVQQNLLNYRHKLGDTEFKQLANLQLQLRSGDRAAADKDLAGFRTKQEIVDNTLTQYGIESIPSKQTTAEKAAVAELQRMLDRRVAAAQATGQKVTNVEIQQTLDDLLSQGTDVPGSWWNVFPGGKTGPFGVDKKRLIDTKPGDIPAAQRKAIEDRLRAKGRPVSDATVLDVYLELQTK